MFNIEELLIASNVRPKTFHFSWKTPMIASRRAHSSLKMRDIHSEMC